MTEQELVELEKPKYTAKDFPCLDFIFDILYHDGTYEYEIQRNGNKRITKNGRMPISYIDEDVSIDRIKEQIDNTNLDKALEINFSFKHHIQGEKHYKVPCFIILLHN